MRIGRKREGWSELEFQEWLSHQVVRLKIVPWALISFSVKAPQNSMFLQSHSGIGIASVKTRLKRNYVRT